MFISDVMEDITAIDLESSFEIEETNDIPKITTKQEPIKMIELVENPIEIKQEVDILDTKAMIEETKTKLMELKRLQKEQKLANKNNDKSKHRIIKLVKRTKLLFEKNSYIRSMNINKLSEIQGSNLEFALALQQSGFDIEEKDDYFMISLKK